MSRERVRRALRSLGLSEPEARVYVYLATKGARSVSEIGSALKLGNELLNKSLISLQGKGVVRVASEGYVLFCALPFKEALESLLKTHLKEAKLLEQGKSEISRWQAMIKSSTSKPKASVHSLEPSVLDEGKILKR